MIQLTSAQLDAWLAALLYPLARILALFSIAPVLGNTAIPARVRIGLGVLITLALIPALPAPPAISPGSGIGLVLIAEQILIGLAIGFVVRVIFASIDLAGDLVDLQMGLGFANYYDPQMPSSSTLTSQLFGIMATLIFLAMNGHLLLITALAESFRWLPLAGPAPGAALMQSMVEQGSRMFAIGLLFALPMIAAMLVTNLTFGVLTRAAPQLNIISIGFPLTVSVGLVVLTVALPTIGTLMGRLLLEWVRTMPGLFGG